MVQVTSLFKSGGTKQLKAKTTAKPPAKKTIAPGTKKVTPVRKPAGTQKSAGFRKYEGDALWLPNTTRPEWLSGELPGDRGFDPLGLAKPVSYLQYDIDQNDQNAAVNKKGNIVGEFAPTVDQVSEDRLQPYSEVFGLQRFRECELIHGRWAMLGALGALVGEASTGVTWWEAGKVELDGARYLDFNLPFTVSQLVIIEVLLVGGAELYRNSELDPEKRIYPGGLFDPLNLASGDDPERIFKLKEAELKHGRLAMVAFLGYSVQAGFTREGVLGSLAKFANSF